VGYQLLTEIAFAFALVAVCVALHSSGMVLLFDWLSAKRAALERRTGMANYTLLLISAFSIITLLHLTETCLWAAFYYWRQLFPDFETALYFSLGSYTTIGYGDVVLPQRWRLLGGIEGICGVLLAGLSTAFVFALVNAVFQIRMNQQGSRQKKTAAEVYGPAGKVR